MPLTVNTNAEFCLLSKALSWFRNSTPQFSVPAQTLTKEMSLICSLLLSSPFPTPGMGLRSGGKFEVKITGWNKNNLLEQQCDKKRNCNSSNTNNRRYKTKKLYTWKWNNILSPPSLPWFLQRRHLYSQPWQVMRWYPIKAGSGHVPFPVTVKN